MAKKEKVSTEVATIAPAALAVAPPPSLPSTVEMTKQDKLYPVLRMVHGMTKKENKENPNGPAFVQGDMVVYPSRTKVAKLNEVFSIIFLRNTLEWVNFEEVMIGGKAREEWRSEEPRDSGNEDLPLSFTQDGKKMKRYRQITLFVLLPEQVDLFLKDALSDEPMGRGLVTPVALKTRNYSRTFAKELLDKIAGDEFIARNRARVQAGKPPIPPYVYEHHIAVEDFTNKAGNTFPILAYKKIGPVMSKEVLDYASFAYENIAKEQKLQTITVDEDSEMASAPRGVVSDEV